MMESLWNICDNYSVGIRICILVLISIICTCLSLTHYNDADYLYYLLMTGGFGCLFLLLSLGISYFSPTERETRSKRKKKFIAFIDKFYDSNWTRFTVLFILLFLAILNEPGFQDFNLVKSFFSYIVNPFISASTILTCVLAMPAIFYSVLTKTNILRLLNNRTVRESIPVDRPGYNPNQKALNQSTRNFPIENQLGFNSDKIESETSDESSESDLESSPLAQNKGQLSQINYGTDGSLKQ